MKVSSFFKNLDSIGEDFGVAFKTPDGKFVPFHFHVTEAASIFKKYKDCGGNSREENYASIQLWVANDYEHRLKAGKLRKIILDTLIENEQDVDIVVEYENDTISVYNIDCVKISANTLIFELCKRKTDCLAPDKCGVAAPKNPCCGTGCC